MSIISFMSPCFSNSSIPESIPLFALSLPYFFFFQVIFFHPFFLSTEIAYICTSDALYAPLKITIIIIQIYLPTSEDIFARNISVGKPIITFYQKQLDASRWIRGKQLHVKYASSRMATHLKRQISIYPQFFSPFFFFALFCASKFSAAIYKSVILGFVLYT